MDIDPLSDSVPPRYAVESDEEEDEINPPRSTVSQEGTKIAFETIGDISEGPSLVIASGYIGTLWAKGIELGEQSGGIFVNKVQIGLIFNPEWTKSTVIISEALSRLPLFAMHQYSQRILDSFKPTSVAILDTYPSPTYATDAPIAFQDAPIRYLSTSEDISFSKSDAEPFEPPNLLQSTSASFISILSVGETKGTAILLPSPHVPRPAPKEVLPSNISFLSEDNIEWPSQLVNLAQKLVFQSVNETVDAIWTPPDHDGQERAPKRSTEVGEGGMYI